MSASRSHRHHVVPKFWLRLFADDTTKLHCYDITVENPRATPVHVRSATVEEDFYVIDGLEGTYDIEEQKTMQRLDNDGARVMTKLVRTVDLTTVWPLSGAERNSLSAFFTAQILRTPKFRDHAQQLVEHHLAKTDRPVHGIDLFRNGLITGEPEVLEKARRYYGVWLAGEKAPSNFHAQVFRDNFNPLHARIFGMRWMIMRSPTPTYLLSDNPVALLRNLTPTYPPPICTIDYLTAHVMVVALARDLVLVGDWHPPELLRRAKSNGDVVVPFDAGRAGSAWAYLVANAEQFVYAQPKDPRMADLLAAEAARG